jgi:7-cyano-7-deazaguanine synthase in queuosine biosynthesis
MAKDLAIVLNNGGINSAVATALAAQKYRPILLFVDSGAVASRARAAYDLQVGHFKPYREHTLSMPFLATVAAPANTAGVIADPRLRTPVAPQLLDLMPLLATALRFAAHYSAAAVYCGLRMGPSPDELAQATEYGQIWNEIVQIPCAQPDLTVEWPLLELEPWQVVDLAFQVNVPMDKTWSCHEDVAEPCGVCAGCRARDAAFQQAAKADPMRAIKKA